MHIYIKVIHGHVNAHISILLHITIYTKIKSKFKTKNLYTIHCVQLSQSILVLLSITLSLYVITL